MVTNVSMILFGECGHLTDEALDALKNGRLDGEELLLVSEHTASCETCAGALADRLSGSGEARVPAGFSEEVGRRAFLRRESRVTFIWYAAKVACAACASLAILFSCTAGAWGKLPEYTRQVKTPGFGFVDNVSDRLRSFSQQLIHLEEYSK